MSTAYLFTFPLVDMSYVKNNHVFCLYYVSKLWDTGFTHSIKKSSTDVLLNYSKYLFGARSTTSHSITSVKLQFLQPFSRLLTLSCKKFFKTSRPTHHLGNTKDIYIINIKERQFNPLSNNEFLKTQSPTQWLPRYFSTNSNRQSIDKPSDGERNNESKVEGNYIKEEINDSHNAKIDKEEEELNKVKKIIFKLTADQRREILADLQYEEAIERKKVAEGKSNKDIY